MKKKYQKLVVKIFFVKKSKMIMLEKKDGYCCTLFKRYGSFEEKKLTIAAYIKRNDPRDALILNKKKT